MDSKLRFDTDGINIYAQYDYRKYYKLPQCVSFKTELVESYAECFYAEFIDIPSNFINEIIPCAMHWIILDYHNRYRPILFSDIVNYAIDGNCFKLILKRNDIDTLMTLGSNFQELAEDLKMDIDFSKFDNRYVSSAHMPCGIMMETLTHRVTIPVMDDIFYNAPYTTIKWQDGTTTTVKAGIDDEFNKEYGLAMAIAKKYYECLEAPNPRAAFKKAAYKDAHDQTEKTAEKRAYKEEKKKRNKRNGRVSSSKKSSKR